MAQSYIYRLQLTERYHQAESFDAHAGQVFKEHFDYLVKAKERGQVLIVGRTDVAPKDNFGLVIFTAASDEAARHFSEQDPGVIHGVMRAEVYPFRLALCNHEGLAKMLTA